MELSIEVIITAIFVLLGLGVLYSPFCPTNISETQDVTEPVIIEYTSEYTNTNACIYGCNTMFEKLTNTDLDETTEQTYEEKKCVDICIDNYF